MRTLKLSTGLLAASSFLAGTANGDILFNDFNSITGLTLVGDAAKIGNRLRVAPAFANQAGAAWFDTRQNVTDPFTTEFRFDLSTAGADGLVFVIQREGLSAIGGSGEQLGYHGIQNSIAVELDHG